ncbi:MAG TPA: alpha-galactosidase [Oscillospiraceae bacterium]|nr:alpha-galactosidase [Oscillospiraceae bacterium]
MDRYSNPKAEKTYRSMLEELTSFPFSFEYDGLKYDGFSKENFTEISRETAVEDKKEKTVVIFEFRDGLQIMLETAFYPSHGVFEWTVWFENKGKENTAVLSELKSTLRFEGKRPVLKGILGDLVNFYRPYSHDLGVIPVHFASNSGRPTHINFPYFNLEYGDEGVMLAIGWSGTWTADFNSDGVATEYTARSTNEIHTYLKPGEKIRTALFVMAPYSVRDENYATNFWRSWFIECNLPKENTAGDALKPFSTCCLSSDTGLPNSDGSISERFTTWRPSLEKMFAEQIKVDFRWVDAGWYTDSEGNTVEEDWWGTVGSWELDPVKWPGKTFRESTDFTKEHGMKTLLWFEPERVTNPEALEQTFGYKAAWAVSGVPGNKGIVSNIGIPACLKWTTERICKVLRENGIDMYREDNNSNPNAGWRFEDEHEGKSRRGITECKVVMAHYQLWDDIIACTLGHGGCGFVDSCASGGGRNDLESMRRGVPLLRSDADRTTTALRLSMTTAFEKWIPFCGANTKEKKRQLDPTGISDVYTWRASYLPILNVDSQFVQDPDQDFEILRFGLNEWKKISPYLLKDFYVLTPWHSQEDKSGFTVFCYYDNDAKEGVLQLFRMEDCPENTLFVKLPFAEESSDYLLTDEDTHEQKKYTGKQLKSGVCFDFDQPGTARVFWVKKA